MKTNKKREFGRVEALRRRMEHLDRRISAKIGSDYDKAEASALKWAIPLLEDHMMNKTIARLPKETRERFGFEVSPLYEERYSDSVEDKSGG